MNKKQLLILSVTGVIILTISISLIVIYVPNRAPAEGAEYEITFAAMWSESSHPYDFPPSPHWSGLIGATHAANVTFWEIGGLASLGIKDVAEFGSKASLTNEVNIAISNNTAFSLISGPGINPSPGLASTEFTISREFPLVTVISMIAPSPDWFTGINSVSLLEEGEWVDELVLLVYLYDAGTDSGLTYTAANNATIPQIPIIQITPLELPGSDIAYGTFTFTRL
jgi:hypothetical protein